jgi:hypothetical protein
MVPAIVCFEVFKLKATFAKEAEWKHNTIKTLDLLPPVTENSWGS